VALTLGSKFVLIFVLAKLLEWPAELAFMDAVDGHYPAMMA
jgi:hypothetical protein